MSINATLAGTVLVPLVTYLWRVNRLMSGVPEDVKHKVASPPWTQQQVEEAYHRVEKQPLTTTSFRDRLPPKLERRYIVTGGSGLVGGYIVLQLLARGQSPETIRIVDYQAPHRRDMLTGPAAEVDFVKTDITSDSSVSAAFSKPWPESVAHLPLTVFHTAAVIVSSERSPLTYGVVENVNVEGTARIVSAARSAGADVLVFTSSGSIGLRPVEYWVAPWRISWPRFFAQHLDAKDFDEPLRSRGEFFANYTLSKAKAERIVCGANCPELRTGAIRPVLNVYGQPTDLTVGAPLKAGVYPAWFHHSIQSFTHGLNCAVAHLNLESVLASGPHAASSPQAGRPFIITDPSPPISYTTLWSLLSTLTSLPSTPSTPSLSATKPLRTVHLPPILLLLASHIIEPYTLLRVAFPILTSIFPDVPGDAKVLQPAIFTVTTHVTADNDTASKPVEKGGIGYEGLVTTLEGLCQQVYEWKMN